MTVKSNLIQCDPVHTLLRTYTSLKNLRCDVTALVEQIRSPSCKIKVALARRRVCSVYIPTARGKNFSLSISSSITLIPSQVDQIKAAVLNKFGIFLFGGRERGLQY